MKIFIGGSKTVKELSPCMIKELDRVCREGYEVLVGDCGGADRLVQEYLHEHGYTKVTVYLSGTRVRNNAGAYPVKHIDAEGLSGFEFYRQKDIAMANDADCALMFWDGKSKGTRCNTEDMEGQGKPVAVIVIQNKEKTMSYDFPSFIDSKAISAHIKKTGYEFTPAEQAVLIANSYNKTIDEKLEALEYLYDRYTDKDFGEEQVGMFYGESEMTFRQKLRRYIDGMNSSLALKQSAQGYIFIAAVCEEGYDYSDCEKTYFSSYQQAYEYLKAQKDYYADEIPDCICEYRITVKPEGKRYGYDHTFDNEFRLVSADAVLPIDDEQPELDISHYYVWLPLPFKKGDLVRIRYAAAWRFKQEYAVFSWEADKKNARFLRMREKHRRQGDYTDMFYPLDHFIEENDSPLGGTFTYDHYYPLDLDYLEIGELDKVNSGTKYLAMALDDNSEYNLKDLLSDYSWGNFRYRELDEADDHLRKKIGEQNEV